MCVCVVDLKLGPFVALRVLIVGYFSLLSHLWMGLQSVVLWRSCDALPSWGADGLFGIHAGSGLLAESHQDGAFRDDDLVEENNVCARLAIALSGRKAF